MCAWEAECMGVSAKRGKKIQCGLWWQNIYDMAWVGEDSLEVQLGLGKKFLYESLTHPGMLLREILPVWALLWAVPVGSGDLSMGNFLLAP